MDKSVLTFPYQYKQIEFGKVFNPYIPVSVRARWGWQNLWFLVDSGADTTMLTLSLANQLGLNINKNKRSRLFGIGEKSVIAYPGKIDLKFKNVIISARCYFIDTEDSTLLLGRLDIFDKFNIFFDSTNQKVVFNRP
ncbi:hypothetical protein CO165_02325 [Candidatus Roizmanbacteria bacterium CG_4_9_14_3_um_filter_33_18]|uniref:Peptidase A2 domain-containing protein n=1 Tax=Candidatus Roizmanbacteria bacterium CG_4_9_14_3_um_filter_33_18 TaxID=1974841 RepID=A0A2M7XY62_9BACT|nr:MAG: hypothetical protein CO165_02325 [Candidatus Roizmanbacteria bacterium CG_4_9_14_3_um_filter_33_18]